MCLISIVPLAWYTDKMRKMKLFVAGKALVCCEGKVLLLRESQWYKEGTKTGNWDVPGGRIHPSESIRDGLLREVEEETGLSVKVDKLLGAFDGFPVINGAEAHVVRLYFVAYADTKEVRLSSDHNEYTWINPRDTKTMPSVDDIDEMLRTLVLETK